MITKVLDTNILLDRPFEETLKLLSEKHDNIKVVVPLSVLVELDTFKNGSNPINANCRSTIRFIETLRHLGVTKGQNLVDGVIFGNIRFCVHIDTGNLDETKVDNLVIKTARELSEYENDVEILSEDIHERILANICGITSNSLASKDINIDKLYTGKAEIQITENQLEELYKDRNSRQLRTRRELEYNQFVIMTDPTGQVHYGIYDKEFHVIRGLKDTYEAWGIKPKRGKDGRSIREQTMLMHLLLDKNINLVTCVGPSGSGKTFLALAAALEQTIYKEIYDKIVVIRPLVHNDIGALPGDKLDKLRPWMGSVFDNLEYLLSIEGTSAKLKDLTGYGSTIDRINDLIQNDIIELEAFSFIRGRSIPNQFIIVDDCQNMSVSQAVTILTRVGEGSKIVLLGDIAKQQIDDPRLSPSNNGLTYIVDKTKGISPLVGHITMEQVVRSPLAELVVKISSME